MRVRRNSYAKDNGTLIEDYYVVERADFVLVVAQLSSAVILVRQYRAATEKSYLCLPAGYVRVGEDPIAAAERELREETGFAGRDFQLVGTLDPLPGYVRSRGFVVKCGVSVKDSIPATDDEATETISVEWADVLDFVRHGEINEMQAVAAILLVALIDGRP